VLDWLLPLWGARGSEFESRRPDQRNKQKAQSSDWAFCFYLSGFVLLVENKVDVSIAGF
jgi:hypothetical protein